MAILIMPIGFKPITNHLSKTHIKVGDAPCHHKRLPSQSECYSDFRKNLVQTII
jgi:hypothetical protein